MNAIRKEIEAWIDYKRNFKQNREKILTGRCTGNEEFAEISSEGTPMCRSFDMMCNQCPLYRNICDIQNGDMPVQFVVDMEKQALRTGLTKRAYSMVLTKIDEIISYLERVLRAQGDYTRDVSYEAYYMQSKVAEEEKEEREEREGIEEEQRSEEDLVDEPPQQTQEPQESQQTEGSDGDGEKNKPQESSEGSKSKKVLDEEDINFG